MIDAKQLTDLVVLYVCMHLGSFLFDLNQPGGRLPPHLNLRAVCMLVAFLLIDHLSVCSDRPVCLAVVVLVSENCGSS